MKRLLILTFCGAIAIHAAIQRDGESAPAKKETPAPKVEEKPEPLLERLFRKRQERSAKPEMKSQDLSKLLRDLLEEQGVPKEDLKESDLLGLLKKLREKNGKGLFPGLEELGDMLNFENDPKVAERLNNHFKELLDGSRPGAAKAAPATLALRDGKKPADTVAFATAVKADGWLLTKASEVDKVGQLECEVKGAWVPAKVERTWREHDLALLKVDAKELPAIRWSTNPAPTVGTFVTAVAPAGQDPVALGVVSVATRNLQNKGRGFLGVQLDSDEIGLKIREVVPDGAANGAGVQKDDRILELDGQKPDSVFNFTKMVSERKAGEKVKLKLQRGKDVVEKEIQLGDRAALGTDLGARFDRMNALGSTVNKRKGDFAAVIQTDLPVEANQCGGPVTDLDGNALGIMIARSGRIESLVVPSSTIRDLLAEVDAAKK